MTTVPLRQRDLFTRKWRRLEQPQKEVWSLHIPLVTMLRWCLRPDVIFRHVPNGEHRDLKTAQKLKAMGVLPGSSDLEFHWCEWETREVKPVGENRVVLVEGKVRRMLHLELKVASRPQSAAQEGFELAMRLLGDEYHVARSIDEAIKILGERGLLRSDVEVCGRRW